MLRRTVLFQSLAALPGLALAQAVVPAPTVLSGEAPAYKVGDTWHWVRSDRRTGLKETENRRVITKVSPERIEGTENDGLMVMSGDLNLLETPEYVRTGTPRFIDFPLSVGKKWSFKYTQASKTGPQRTRWQYDAEVVAQERVKVPAGEFDAYKVVGKGYWNSETGSASGSGQLRLWYAPAARGSVKLRIRGRQHFQRDRTRGAEARSVEALRTTPRRVRWPRRQRTQPLTTRTAGRSGSGSASKRSKPQ